MVNLYRPAWDDYEVVVAEERDEAARQALLGRRVAPAELDKLLDERFRRHGAYLVPHDQFDFARPRHDVGARQRAPAYGPDAWHPDDALLVPLTASDGRRLAFLSLDEPVDGRRPDDARARGPRPRSAAIVASVIEHAQLAAEAAATALRSSTCCACRPS